MNALKNPNNCSYDMGILPCRHESLPGQQSLFPEDDLLSMPSEASAFNLCGELFYTGRDLPGSRETLQEILWDVL